MATQETTKFTVNIILSSDVELGDNSQVETMLYETLLEELKDYKYDDTVRVLAVNIIGRTGDFS